MNRRVPFVDLRAQYATIRSEIDAAIAGVLDTSAYIGGPAVERFEREFAAWMGMPLCAGCANGTDSLEILLEAMGIAGGAEVLVPAHTWISTAEAVTRAGAVPVFVDTDPATYTIDPSRIEGKLTSRTRAIIPVHLYGHPCDMDALMAIAHRHGLRVIEDCAQAHGARYRGSLVGTFGDAASFSFYPGKNLGAYGDAGGIITRDEEIWRRFKMIANHGRLGKHDHAIEGRNSRLDGLQAAVLAAKLPHLDGWVAARRANAGVYSRLLAPAGIEPPRVAEGCEHAYHLYVVQVPERDRVREELAAVGVETGIHYPMALPMLAAYRRFGHRREDFPVSTRAVDQILSLPMYAELSSEEIAYVCSALVAAVARCTQSTRA